MGGASKRRYQKRGRERREHILKTALELLKDRDLETLSLADIASGAEIPLSSLYHFFPDINSLWSELIPVFYRRLLVYWKDEMSLDGHETWPELMRAIVDKTSDFYRDHVEYQQLILGGKTPAYFKHRQMEKGDMTVRAMERALRPIINVQEIPNKRLVYGNVFQIIEHFLTLSVIRENKITEAMQREAARAGIAYLSLYLGPYTGIRASETEATDETPATEEAQTEPLEATSDSRADEE